MRLLDYVRQLAPITERRELLNQITNLRQEYDLTLAPILSDIEDTLAKQPIKSDIGARLETDLHRNVNFNGNPYDLLLRALRNLPSNFETLEKEIRRLFTVQFTNSNLTFNRANILRYVDGLSFFIRYARKLFLIAIAQESMKLGNATPNGMTKAEQEWVYSNLNQFTQLYPAMSVTGNDLKNRFNAASSAEVNEETYDVAVNALTIAQRDPLMMDGFSPRQNPFVLFGKMLAEVQYERFKEAEQECFALQLRLQEMRELQSEQGVNPVLQNHIKQYERRISDYEYRLNRLREKSSASLGNLIDASTIGIT